MSNRLKTFLVVAGMSLVLFGSVVALLTSCEAPPQPIKIQGIDIRVIKFDGHEYLAFDGVNHDSGVVHSESCPCKSK